VSNGRENTSFSWHRVLDHLGLIPLFTFNYTANYESMLTAACRNIGGGSSSNIMLLYSDLR